MGSAPDYIGLNPVRAGMVAAPSDYRWSSYRVNVQGEDDGWLRAHPSYEALSEQIPLRRSVYRELCASGKAK